MEELVANCGTDIWAGLILGMEELRTDEPTWAVDEVVKGSVSKCLGPEGAIGIVYLLTLPSGKYTGSQLKVPMAHSQEACDDSTKKWLPVAQGPVAEALSSI